MTPTRFPSPRRGFTLIELLVVIAIIVLLMALLLPAIQKIRETANRLTCCSRMRQIALAVHTLLHSQGRLPFGQVGDWGYDPVTGSSAQFGGFDENSRSWSWLAKLLPHLEQDNLFAGGDIPRATISASGVAARPIPLFLCPSEAGTSAGVLLEQSRYLYRNAAPSPVGVTNYKGVMGDNFIAGPWFNLNPEYPGYWGSDPWCCGNGAIVPTDWSRQKTFASIDDGAAYTFLVGEDVHFQPTVAPGDFDMIGWGFAWFHPYETVRTCAIPPNAVRMPPANPNDLGNLSGFKSMHPGGLNFAMVDASVRFVANSIDLRTYRALATIRQRELAQLPE